MSKQEIVELIEKYQTIIVHRHVRPDPDALGSQGGLAQLIRDTYPEKKVFEVGEEEESLTFLTKMDDVSDEQYQQALVIVCDTANQARISDQRYNMGEKLIKIDHHPVVDAYGDVQWVDTTASSTSEMVYELFEAGKPSGLTLTQESARLLYAGIVGDTGRFLFPSSTKRTLQIAADLVAYDFDRPELYEDMYKTPHDIARLKGYILQHFTVSPLGLSTVKLSKELLDEYGITPSQTSSLVGVLGDIEGIIAWVIFVEEETQIRVRLRSKGPVINEVAAMFDGGGHPMASGATIYSWDEMDRVTAALEKVCKEYQNKA
ncbi:bifunctional oligoribonuclease/PAP phosphatase NrnA [Pontibacillus yanchengensis]|uniref:Bifunctional oligoribonuclease/PAP phosphatase NrnA n=2 Tax=Pontibacillus yanchengensis TaxID=462910 RepID=A0ACC7VGA2_9BACI|nr:bifunctional oligoribonuclease/PAP phosphatase NrnA [Pontibacillus yanchengensis]MYL34131.1 bifunctional oligoribonuclease/PAP phosphatase NrnA [Pontibacillus yanchengensis]MYL53224.1 bifunctional oligoribonuclease/PAP phosphatase NrnA [Pontibacillus yanchengensis]